MRIAHIAPPFTRIPPKKYGGTERVLAYLIAEQVAQGHEVTLLAPGDAKTVAQHHVSFIDWSLRDRDVDPVRNIDLRVPWSAQMEANYHYRRCFGWIEKHCQEIDVLHLHLTIFNDLERQLPALNYLPNVLRRIATVHGRFPFDRAQVVDSQGERVSWEGKADQLYIRDWGHLLTFVPISYNAKKDIHEALGYCPNLRLASPPVYNALPQSEFAVTTRETGDYWVWLGRFVPKKGAHLAVEAALEAGTKLILAGIIQDEVQQAYFDRKIAPHIEKHVTQISYVGEVDEQQRRSLLDGACGLLNPIMWEEPFGMVMIEAMARGCPVIAFPRGAAVELVPEEGYEGKRIGFLASDVDQMAAAMKQIGDIDLNQVITYCRGKFAVADQVRAYQRLYQSEESFPLPKAAGVGLCGTLMI